MKLSRFAPLPLLLLFAPLVSAQANKSNDWKIEVTYDKFRDVSTVGIQPMLVRDDKATVPTVLFAAFNCPGQRSVCTPEGVIIGFALVTGEERYRGEGIGRSIRDGIRQEPYKLVYMGLLPASLGIPFDSHGFKALFRVEAFTKIANSKQVEFQIDHYEFALTPQNLEALRDLAEHLMQ